MAKFDSINIHVFDLDKIMTELEHKKYPGEYIKIVDCDKAIVVFDPDDMKIASITKTSANEKLDPNHG